MGQEDAMNRALPYLLPAAGLVVMGMSVAWYANYDDLDQPHTYVEADFETLHETLGYVRLAGMAHVGAVVRSATAATLFQEQKNWYLYGFFPPYDTESRWIHVMVFTDDPPDDFLNYELLILEGRLSEPTRRTLPLDADFVIASSGGRYRVAPDVLILEPVHRLAFDEAAWAARREARARVTADGPAGIPPTGP
jgi:hypothetical protein